MKTLVLLLALTASSTFAQGSTDAMTRKLSLPSDWSLISCRQLENGGVTIQRRNLETSDQVTIYAPAYQTPVYEVFINGDVKATCRFLTIK